MMFTCIIRLIVLKSLSKECTHAYTSHSIPPLFLQVGLCELRRPHGLHNLAGRSLFGPLQSICTSTGAPFMGIMHMPMYCPTHPHQGTIGVRWGLTNCFVKPPCVGMAAVSNSYLLPPAPPWGAWPTLLMYLIAIIVLYVYWLECVNSPSTGQAFLVKSRIDTTIVPRWGVVGQYIDRCIRSVAYSVYCMYFK